MGIYIDMEMPTNEEIFLRIDEKGEVYVYGSYPSELHKAIPVPSHGDLIDRDKVGLTDFEIMMCNGDYKEGMKMLLEKIASIPAIIIPAEEE